MIDKVDNMMELLVYVSMRIVLNTIYNRSVSLLVRISARDSFVQTPEHFLQSCSLYHQATQQVWSTLGVCRGVVPDIQVCDTHRREDLVNATITSNAEEEEEDSFLTFRSL